jgi:hypothetical protein
MNSVPWKNPRILFTLLVVFLSGAGAGAVTARFGLNPERHKPAPSWKDGPKEISLARFKKELGLTPKQAGEIEIVLDDFMTYYQTLQAQMDDVRATGKIRIMKLLSDEQKQKFDRMLTDLQAKQIH